MTGQPIALQRLASSHLSVSLKTSSIQLCYECCSVCQLHWGCHPACLLIWECLPIHVFLQFCFLSAVLLPTMSDSEHKDLGVSFAQRQPVYLHSLNLRSTAIITIRRRRRGRGRRRRSSRRRTFLARYFGFTCQKITNQNSTHFSPTTETELFF